MFSSPDGGKTWPTGTAQCHDGDRPWLAGGAKNEVFMSTDTLEGNGSGHEVFRSTDAGASCSSNSIEANGTLADGTFWSGDGKLWYDHLNGSLVEPAYFEFPKGNFGVGIDVLPNASQAFSKSNASFIPYVADANTSMLANWPAVAIDRAGTIYVTWSTNDRKPHSSGGCNGANTPLPNSILLTYSRDGGKSWAAPITVAHPGTTVLWPWIAAGSAGNVSVVWYQYDRVTDPDCGKGAVSVYESSIFHTTDPSSRTIYRVDASGRPIYTGDIRQEGTTCVATGQDRRLGDYFTNTLDPRGCVIIATGDTMLTDPATGAPYPTSRPLFIAQDAGPSLTGQDCAASAGAQATKVG